MVASWANVRLSRREGQQWGPPGRSPRERPAGPGCYNRRVNAPANPRSDADARSERPSGRLLLIDGHGIIHRSFHALKDAPLTVRRTGEVVTAVYGLASTLLSVMQELK